MSAPTYPPKKINNVVSNIFNSSDYQTVGNDLKYVKLSGSSMTGSLACQGLTTTGTNTISGTNKFNTNIGLPSVYNSAPNSSIPNISQLGGNSIATSTSVPYTASTITNLLNISLNQGIYLLNYQVVLTNTSGVVVTVSSFSCSVSTTNNVLDQDYRLTNHGSQSIAATAGVTTLLGSNYYQLISGTSATLYLNYNATASASLNVSGYIRAIRIG